MQQQDLARIRLVTRRYDEMQGLGRISIGAGLVAGAFVADQVLHPGAGWWGFLWPSVVAVCIVIPGKLTSDRLYARRFGRVRKTNDAEKGAWRGLWLGLVFAAAMIAGEQLPARSPNLFLLAMGIMPTRAFVQDWPFRKYLAVEAIAAIAASLLFVTPDPSLARDTYDDLQIAAVWNGFGLFGIAAMVTGMLDHRLLTSTLGGGQVSDAECEHVDSV